ncbi:monooxygenase [Reticulibacter mediterranei]|uniref:Monooxygenase n=1 Tax=Reticulibacter mediterranei TaxID=2778369 RepID=A0A8J3IM44_9CHLR|nr:NAD(P)-binding domain-containing protein [Reticulibacter mediterranei]GHO94888.1 monooxygenase [Reticulibacter mediterranei]
MFETLVIGAGQAGLAAGYTLQRAGLDFLIVEAGSSPTGSWGAYYESLTLFSPARFSSLPGMPFPGPPERYPKRDEVIAYLQSYAQRFHLPIQLQTRVERIERVGQHFRVDTSTGKSYEALSIIIATGAFHHPNLPLFPGQDLFRGQILHSAAYRRPEPFRGQRVLIVGAGESAVQIAVEVARMARVAIASRAPLRYRPQRVLGRDIHFWAWLTGLDRLPLGRFWEQHAPTAIIETGRYQEAFATGALDRRPLFQRFTNAGVVWEDGSLEAVDSVIFATGYRPSFGFLADLGALDAQGQALQHQGISLTAPGLYYLGLNFQRTFASATLRGGGPDAAFIIRHLKRWLRSSTNASSPGNASLAESKV